MESDLSLIEISGEDDSLLQQIPSDDISNNYFSCSPLQRLSAKRSADSSRISQIDIAEGMKGNENIENPSCLSTIDNSNKENSKASKSKVPKFGVEPQQMKRKKGGGFNLRKSLAWNKAFFTEEGVLDPLELSMITGAVNKSSPLDVLSVVHEERRTSLSGDSNCSNDSADFQAIEEILFKEIPANNLSGGNKMGGGLFRKHNSSAQANVAPSPVATRKALSVYDVNRNGPKRGGCPRPVSISFQKRFENANTTKAASKESKLPKIPVSKPDPSLLPTNIKAAKLGASRSNCNQIAQRAIIVQNGNGLKGSTNKTSSAQNIAKSGSDSKASCFKNSVQPSRSIMVSSPLEISSSSNLLPPKATKSNSGSDLIPDSVHPATGIQAFNGRDRSSKAAVSLPKHAQYVGGDRQRVQPQAAKPSGLRMPSPSLRFFDQPKTVESQSLLQCSQPRNIPESSIPNLRKLGPTDSISELRPPLAIAKTVTVVDDVKATRNVKGLNLSRECSVPSTLNSASHENMKLKGELNNLQRVEQKVPHESKRSEPIRDQQKLHSVPVDVDKQIQEGAESRKVEKLSCKVDTGLQMNDSILVDIDKKIQEHEEPRKVENISCMVETELQLNDSIVADVDKQIQEHEELPKVEKISCKVKTELQLNDSNIADIDKQIQEHEEPCKVEKISCKVETELQMNDSILADVDKQIQEHEEPLKVENISCKVETGLQLNDSILADIDKQIQGHAEPCKVNKISCKVDIDLQMNDNGLLLQSELHGQLKKEMVAEVSTKSRNFSVDELENPYFTSKLSHAVQVGMVKHPQAEEKLYNLSAEDCGIISESQSGDVSNQGDQGSMCSIDEHSGVQVELIINPSICKAAQVSCGGELNGGILLQESRTYEETQKYDRVDANLIVEGQNELESCHGSYVLKYIEEKADEVAVGEDVTTIRSSESSEPCKLQKVDTELQINDNKLEMQTGPCKELKRDGDHKMVSDDCTKSRDSDDELENSEINTSKSSSVDVSSTNVMIEEHLQAEDEVYNSSGEDERVISEPESGGAIIYSNQGICNVGGQAELIINPCICETDRASHQETHNRILVEESSSSEESREYIMGDADLSVEVPSESEVETSQRPPQVRFIEQANKCGVMVAIKSDVVEAHEQFRDCNSKLGICAEACEIKKILCQVDSKLEMMNDNKLLLQTGSHAQLNENIVADVCTKSRDESKLSSAEDMIEEYPQAEVELYNLSIEDHGVISQSESEDNQGMCDVDKQSELVTKENDREDTEDRTLLQEITTCEEQPLQNLQGERVSLESNLENSQVETNEVIEQLVEDMQYKLSVKNDCIISEPPSPWSCSSESNQVGAKDEILIEESSTSLEDIMLLAFGKMNLSEEAENTTTPTAEMQHNVISKRKSGNDGKEEDVLLIKPPPNAVPFSDEWLAAAEAAGEHILSMKTGAVQHSPTDKSLPEPGPWSPVKRKSNQVGPFDCTKYTNIQPPISQ